MGSSPLTVADLEENPEFLEDLLSFIGGDDEGQLAELAANNTSSACGEVIKPGESFFVCRDCGLYPNRGGDHKGHDYKLIPVEDIGCCDCGDLLVWKKEGCCPLHQGVESEVTLTLPPDLHARANLAFTHLASYFRDTLLKANKGDQNATEHLAVMVDWLVSVAKTYGMVLMREWVDVMVSPAAQLQTPLPSPSSLLGLILELDSRPAEHMSESVREIIHDLLFHLVADASFKRAFGTEVTLRALRYKDLANTLGTHKTEAAEDTPSGSMLEFDIQLFTGRELGTILGTNGLLAQIVEYMYFGLENILISDPLNPKRKIPDPSRIIQFAKFWELPHQDLELALQHPGNAHWFVYESGLFTMFVSLMGLVEETGGRTRIIPTEPDKNPNSWSYYFQFALDLIGYLNGVETGLLSGPDPLEFPYAVAAFKAPASPIVLKEMQKVVDIFAKEIENVATLRDVKFCNLEGGYIATSFDLLRESVSLHAPLKRMFSHVLRTSMLNWNYTLQELLGYRAVSESKIDAASLTGYTNVFPLLLLDQVATMMSFEAQFYAGTWNNHPDGTPVATLGYSYKDVRHRMNFFDADLLTLQLCACMMDSEHLLTVLLDRFGLTLWWSLDQEGISREKRVSSLRPKRKESAPKHAAKPELTTPTEKKDDASVANAEEDVETEKNEVKADENQEMADDEGDDEEEEELEEEEEPLDSISADKLEIQLKSIANNFLKLLIVLSRNRTFYMKREDEIRLEIIQRLAVAPQSHSSLQENIRDTLTSDPLFDKILQEVSTYVLPQGMEQGKYCLKPEYWSQWDRYFIHYYNSHKEAAIEKYEAHCKTIGKQLPFLRPAPLPEVFSGLPKLLQSKIIHKIVYSALQQFLNKAAKHTDQDTLVHILHILHLCLLFSPPPVAEQENTTTGFTFPTNNIFNNSRTSLSTKGKEKEGEGGSTIITMLLEVYKNHHTFKHSVKEIFDLYSADPQSAAQIQQATQQVEGDSNAAEKEQLRKQRQLDIMKRFAEQQKAFLAAKPSADSEDEEGEAPAVSSPVKSSRSEFVCVMCREDTKAEDNPLGYIALVSKSDLLNLQLERKWENFAKEKARVEEQQKAREESKDKEKEKENKEPKSPSKSNAEKTTVPTTGEPNITPVGDKTSLDAPTEASTATDVVAATTTPTTEASIMPETSPAVPQTSETASTSTTPPDNTKELVDSMFSDNEKSTGISIVSCRHVLHQKCFQQYFISLTNKMEKGHPFEGCNEINVYRGEFLCPLCKGLANNLVPIMPEVDPPKSEIQHPFSDSEFSEWNNNLVGGNIDLLANKSNLPPLDYGVNFTIDTQDFEESVHSYMGGKYKNLPTTNSDLSLFDSVVNDISHLELASRDSSKFLLDYTTSHQNQFIQNLALVSVYHASHSTTFPKIRAAFISRLAAVLNAEPNEQQESLPAVLQPNLFDMFVRYVFSVSSTMGRICHFNDAYPFLQVLYPLIISLTAIFTHFSAIGSNLPYAKSVGGLIEAVKTNTTSNNNNTTSSSALQEISRLCLPLLRRVGLFVRVCLQFNEENPRRNFATLADEFQYWLEYPLWFSRLLLINDSQKYLRLPSLDTLATSDNSITKLASKWVHGADFRKLAAPIPFQLIDLPTHYTDLFTTFIGANCSTCGTVPSEPGLCLLCGKLVCVGGNCCVKLDTGECVQHSKTCGAGVGIFLILKWQYIMFIREGSCSCWGSVYLDQYGEEDYALKRGRPLRLSEPRYSQLRGLWVTKAMELLLHQNKNFCEPTDARWY